MGPYWMALLCAHGDSISAALGALGSLCLAVPWVVDLRLRRRSEQRLADAEAAHGDHPLVDTLRRLHTGVLLGSGAAWVTTTALIGTAMLLGSFLLVLGGSLLSCPAG